MARRAIAAVLVTLFLSTPTAADPSREAALRAALEAGDFERVRQDAARWIQEVERDRGVDDASLAAPLELWVEATCEGQWRADAQTRARAERSLQLRQVSADSTTWVASLANLGRCHQLATEYADAADAFARALALARRGETTPVVLAGHERRLAHVLRILGELEAAAPLFDVALSRLESAGGPPAPLVTLLTQRARLHERRRQNDLALADAERAVRVGVAAGDGPYGQALQSLGYHRDRTGDLDGALAAYEEALTRLSRAHGDDHLAVAALLNRFSDHLASRGDMARSRQLLEQNLSIVRRLLPPEHLWVTISLNNLAELDYSDGDFVSARKLHQQILETRLATVGEDHPRVATSLSNLASTYLMTLDLAEAESLYRRALEIQTEAYGPDDYQLAFTLDNLGSVLHRMRRLDEAAASFERAIELLPLEEDEPDLAFTLAAYGELLMDRGQLDLAEAQIQRSLALLRKHSGDWHPRVPENLQNLGRLAGQRGDLARAQAYLSEAVDLFQTHRGGGHFETGNGILDLAQVHWWQGDVDAALTLAARGESISRDHLRLLARGSTEGNALRYAVHRRTGLDLAIQCALRLQSTAAIGTAWDQLVRSRALIFDELAQRRWVTARHDDPELTGRTERLDRARTRLANLTVRGAGDLDEVAYATLLAAAGVERDRAEEALAEASRRYRETRDRDAAGLDEVRAQLDPQTALVAFARAEIDGEDRTVAFVLASTPRLLDLGPTHQIDRRVRAWRDRVLDGAALSGPFAQNAERQVRAAGEELRRTVWDPIATTLGSASLVLVIPEGSLHHVSFAALPWGDGYLVEDARALHVLSSERDLLRPSGEPGQGLLALGGPAFDAEPGPASTHRGVVDAECQALRTVQFDALPAAVEEVRELWGIWNENSSEGARYHLERDATEELFKARAAGHRVLHLATHGFFLGATCGAEVARPLPLAGLQPRDATPRVRVHNPLLTSGLALAAANRRTEVADGMEDGILSGEEIATLDLRGVEWVVLSACDTGVGESVAGEGILGLRRCFLLAGARTMITSLWAVDDEATRHWMTALYRARLVEGLSTAEAMRAASRARLIALREAGQSTHPFQWGAFVAAGDWH